MLKMVLDCANPLSLVPLSLGGGKEVICMEVDLGASLQVYNEGPWEAVISLLQVHHYPPVTVLPVPPVPH